MLVVGLDGKLRRKPGPRAPWLLLIFGIVFALTILQFSTMGLAPRASTAILGLSVLTRDVVTAVSLMFVAALAFAFWRAWREFDSWIYFRLATFAVGALGSLSAISILIFGRAVRLW